MKPGKIYILFAAMLPCKLINARFRILHFSEALKDIANDERPVTALVTIAKKDIYLYYLLQFIY